MTKKSSQPTIGVVFNTQFGFTGVALRGDNVLRIVLALPTPHAAYCRLSQGLPDFKEVSWSLPLVRDLLAYFEGRNPDLSKQRVDLSGLSSFQREALLLAREIAYGQTATYGELATRLGKPGAARAVGLAMSKNPIPIVIPCHRVIGADGSLRGYSARGGIGLKRRLLNLEAG